MSDQSICPNCGQPFVPRRVNQRFCGQRCKWTWTNRNRTLKPNVHFRCKVCNAEVSRYLEPSKLASGQATGEYCSLQCKGAALSGENHPMWQGGRIVEEDGYVMLLRTDHPHANNKGYVFEHRLMMEAHLGRLLDPEEVVHHENDDPGDNRLENLKLFANNAEHKRHEMAERSRDEAGRLVPLSKGG